jgi:CRISPR-associated endonuclease/helicase Cas3
VLLASTQLIEAGVDIDFPLVFRAMAPADSLLQAAGRANREGNLTSGGRVVIFDPEDGSQPPSYKTPTGTTARFLGPGRADPDCLDALGAYYRGLYQDLNLHDRQSRGNRIQRSRHRRAFQTVADGPLTDSGAKKRDRRQAFRLIDDESIAVVTPQGAPDPEERAAIERVVERIRASPAPLLADLRRLQAYTTNLHFSMVRDPGVRAQLVPVLGDEVRIGGLAEWRGDYDARTGITIDTRLEDLVL